MSFERLSDVFGSIFGINIKRWCGVYGVYMVILYKRNKVECEKWEGDKLD